jgi:predicted nucleotidyltransferase
MELKEVRKHKAEMERKVSEALKEFEKETGCKVKSLFYVRRSCLAEKVEPENRYIIDSQIEI